MKVRVTLFAAMVVLVMVGCNSKKADGAFEVYGEIKNPTGTTITLQKMFFNGNMPPEIIDSATLDKGKFNLEGQATEEGLFALVVDGTERGYFFVNDAEKIHTVVDMNDMTNKWPSFETKANLNLRNYALKMSSYDSAISVQARQVEVNAAAKKTDSLSQLAVTDLNALKEDFKKYITTFIDTTPSPTVAMFAMQYMQTVELDKIKTPVNNLAKRFPTHTGIAEIVKQFNAMVTKKENAPTNGKAAPEITLPDVNGKPFSLSSLKGKYVLVDFWASWCGPCRGENPNVVAAYNQFKDKNFTILGVSLDADKGAWIQAIQTDGLTWQHVSDLKQWSSAVVPAYNIEGIPYNVLLNPNGEIIASNLRGAALGAKLAEVLK